MTEDVGENEGTWAARRGAAFALRVVIFLIPVVLSVLGTAVLSRGLPPPESTAVLIVYWVLLSIAATAILYMTDKAARQLLPLQALLNLSLIFPDRAPSRFKAALRTSSVRQLERRIAEVKANGLGDSETEAAETLVELVGALAHHDRLTRGHAERVRAYSRMIGEEMGLEDEAINKLTWAGLMHDVGKLYVPREILNKPGALTPEEFEIIKIHPGAGAELVEPLEDWLGDWLRAVGEHHERWDGDGYPNGLAAEEIALGARIVAVADAFDVLTSARSYKSPSSAARARAEIQRCAGTQFDSTVVRAFLNISVGKFRMVMGPLSWLAQAPVVGVPVAPAVGALAAGFATAVGLLVGGQFQPPTVERAPAAVFAAPSPEPQVDAAVSTSSTSSTTTSSTTSTSTTTTSTTSTTAPPAAVESPASPQSGQTFFDDDTFEAPAPFDAPEAADDVLNGVEDQSSIFAPLANDGEGLTLASVSQPSVGSVTPRLDSTVRFDPPPNWSGTTSFTYTAVDSNGMTTTATVTINYRSAPDAPQTQADWLIRAEDSGPSTIDVTANDSDADLQPLTVTGISRVPSSAPTIGTVSITSGGRIRFVPAANANGNDQFIYFVRDPDGLTASNLLTVTLTPVNDPPLARNDVGSMNEDTTKTFSVRSNDYDVDGGPLTTTSATSTDGTATTNGTTVTYRPAPNSFGTHRVTYTISDGRGGTDSAVLTINVAPVNDPPVAADDIGSMNEDDPTKVFSVLGNDNDIDGGPLSITAATSAFGTASTNGSTVSYQPNPNGNGAHAVTYTISDGRGGTDTGTLTVNVAAVNDPPVFTGGGDDTVAEDFGPRTVPAWATLIGAGPIDEFGQALTFNVTVDDPTLFSSQPTVDPISGDLTYTPAPDANGITTITVTLSDSAGATTAPQTADIIITALNDPPSFTGGTDDTVAEDSGPQTASAWATNMSAGPPNESAQTVTFAVTADDPSLFSVQPAIDSTTGDLTYTPAPDANGITTLAITLTDSSGATSPPQTADITITAVNDDPTFTAGPDELVAEDSGPQTVTGWATGITAGPPDESGQTVTFDVTADDPTLFSTQPAIDPTGELTYTPADDQNGTTTLTITLDDSAGATSPPQTADITISADNDAPGLDPIGAVGGDELTPITFTATATDPDLPPDTLTFSLVGEPTGAAIDRDSGVFTWTPTETQGPGSFTFDVVVSDDGVPQGDDTETITVTVAEANVAPSIDAATGATVGTGNEIDLTPAMLAASDPDLPAQSLSYTLEVAPVNGDVERTGTPLAEGATFTEAEIVAGDIAYEHDGSATTNDSFEVTANDGAGGVSAPATFPITVALVSPTPITISEIRTDSQSGRDFVELYNGSYEEIDLGAENWTVVIENRDGAVLETVALTGTFPINGYALITEAGYAGFGTPDATATIATFERGAGFSVRKAGVEIDAVGTSSGSSFAEGTPLPRMGGTLEQAYVRKNGWGRGACVDTDDNASDFVHQWALFASSPTGIADGFAFACQPPAPPFPPPSPADHPVIREYRTDGPGGGSDEFIEIFNPGPDQDMTNWTVELNKPPFEVVHTFPDGFVLESGRHYLLAGAGYTGAATPDAPTDVGVTNGTGIVLWGVPDGRIDVLGIETGSEWYEPNVGVGLPRIDGRTYHSYERRNNGCTDTDNNFFDFEHHLGFETPTNNSAGPFSCV